MFACGTRSLIVTRKKYYIQNQNRIEKKLGEHFFLLRMHISVPITNQQEVCPQKVTIPSIPSTLCQVWNIIIKMIDEWDKLFYKITNYYVNLFVPPTLSSFAPKGCCIFSRAKILKFQLAILLYQQPTDIKHLSCYWRAILWL